MPALWMHGEALHVNEIVSVPLVMSDEVNVPSETADGGFMAVGSLEPQFWAELVARMELEDLPDRDDRANWPALSRR